MDTVQGSGWPDLDTTLQACIFKRLRDSMLSTAPRLTLHSKVLNEVLANWL
jgi:hypothetical protein